MLLALCELYSPLMHGGDDGGGYDGEGYGGDGAGCIDSYESSDPKQGHYLIYFIVTLEEFYSNSFLDMLYMWKYNNYNVILPKLRYYLQHLEQSGQQQDYSVDYHKSLVNVMGKDKYYQLHIVKPHMFTRVPTAATAATSSISNRSTVINVTQREYERLEYDQEMVENYDGPYMCSIHTHIISIIQRKWKEKYRKRMERKKHLHVLKNYVRRMYDGV
jgi:hypothetical protein